MITSDREQKVLQALKTFGLSDNLAAFATAQAAHETNDFTSVLFKDDNNAFGMTFVGQAGATRSNNSFVGTDGNIYFYAHYETIEMSCYDFTRWYTKARNNILSFPLYISTLVDYVSFLKNRNYFEADEQEYYKRTAYFYNKYFSI